MMRHASTIGLAIASLFACPADAQSNDWNSVTAELDKAVAAEAAKLNGPSFSVAVVSRRHPVFFSSHGYADVAHHVPASPHTIYEIGSISKIFTGTMLMQMRDAGKASLDDPIQKHIPEFRLPSPFTGEARPTLRQLVSHMAGLPRTTPRYSEMEGEKGTAEQALRSLALTEAAFPPFVQFKYSNIDVGLVGYGLARTAGTTWSDYIARNILKPLEMNETSAARGAVPADRVALAYAPGAQGPVTVTPMYFPPLTEAAASMVSSSADLAKFAAWQLDDGDGRVLKPESRREMRAPLWMEDEWASGNGIAWALMRRGSAVLACHGGGTNGYNAMLCVDAKLGVGIVVLGNCMADSQGLALRLIEPILTVAKAERAAADATIPPLPAQAARFAGTYEHDIGLVPPVTVAIEGGRLIMRDDNWGTVFLRPGRAPNAFIATENRPLMGESVTFEGAGSDTRLLIGHGSVVYKRAP